MAVSLCMHACLYASQIYIIFEILIQQNEHDMNDWHIAKNSCKTRMHETYELSDLLNHVSFVLYMPSDAFLLYMLSFFHAPVYPFI